MRVFSTAAIVLLFAVVFAAPSLRAQLLLQSTGARVIDFETDIGWVSNDPLSDGDDVLRASGSTALVEENNNIWKSTAGAGGLSVEAWSWYRSVQYTTPTLFGDANGDGDKNDTMSVNSVARVALADFGLGAGAGDMAWRFGSGTPPGGAYADLGLTLRIRNATGSAITAWYFSLDTWHRNTTTAHHTLTLLYSLDNVAYTPIASATTTTTGGSWVASPLAASFQEAVAPGAYIYLRMDYARPAAGSGAALIWDNWRVVAATATEGYTAPSTPLATATGTSSIALSWNDPNTGETGYQIERSIDGSTGWVLLATLPANTTVYADSSLPESTTFFYRVRALAAYGSSSWSPTVSTFTPGDPPAAPSGLFATAVNGTKIRLSWTDTANEAAFRIEASPTAEGPFSTVGQVPANTTIWFDHSLVPAKSRHYRVIAVNPVGESAASAVAYATTPLVSTVNFFIFANSFSGFGRNLKAIAQSAGDDVNIAIPRAGGIYTADVLDALLGRAAGTVPVITQTQANAMDPITAYSYGWSPLESDYNARVDVQALLDQREWDVISWQSGSGNANSAYWVVDGTAPGVENYFHTLGKEPSARVVYYHSTPYPNDALLLRSPHNLDPYSIPPLPGNLPYTEDQHVFDTHAVALQVATAYDFPSVFGGLAQLNIRYDPRWGLSLPDQSFDYFNATSPQLPRIPAKRRLHFGLAWKTTPQGIGQKVSWWIDAHPHDLLDFLTACLWYEELFRKDVRLTNWAPDGVDADTASLVREVAHQTALGLMPPLRLAHGPSRLAYGDRLWDSSQALLAADDPERTNLAHRNLITLFALIPEHPRREDARALLAAAGKLAEADELAGREVRERPVREAIFQQIWDSSALGTPITVQLGPQSDMDGDGVPAILELKLGMNSLSQDSDNGPTIRGADSRSGPEIVYRHRNAILRSDITLVLEASSDLTATGWIPVIAGDGVTQSVVDPDVDRDGLVELIETRISLEEPAKFLRLKAE